jgi:hypothetical protein
MKNIAESVIAIAIKTGVVAVGAVRRSGELLGRADKSMWPLIPLMRLFHVNVPYVGDTVGWVHVTGPLLFGREQEPVAGQ